MESCKEEEPGDLRRGSKASCYRWSEVSLMGEEKRGRSVPLTSRLPDFPLWGRERQG